MMQDHPFYSPSDEPGKQEQQAMWGHIASRLFPSARSPFFALERRSFLYGMAAALVLMFSSVGVYTTVRNALELAQPTAIQIDNAYQSAIGELQKVALRYETPTTTDGSHAELVAARQEQMKILDAAISSLRGETSSRDVSPLLRARLRDLYGKKLALLQTMVEQGEIEM